MAVPRSIIRGDRVAVKLCSTTGNCREPLHHVITCFRVARVASRDPLAPRRLLFDLSLVMHAPSQR